MLHCPGNEAAADPADMSVPRMPAKSRTRKGKRAMCTSSEPFLASTPLTVSQLRVVHPEEGRWRVGILGLQLKIKCTEVAEFQSNEWTYKLKERKIVVVADERGNAVHCHLSGIIGKWWTAEKADISCRSDLDPILNLASCPRAAGKQGKSSDTRSIRTRTPLVHAAYEAQDIDIESTGPRTSSMSPQARAIAPLPPPSPPYPSADLILLVNARPSGFSISDPATTQK
ncbi:hypothetical protein B0H13DRAFT_1863190 [Mycena leptocephala]|nr:hypothetical protein B0H13DRAFT_1863190 [Mycena leptocephala]